ncbi:MAG: hypothetical protein Ct9H300mP1_19510 [Planctomycetaceae bacterium]|nr:MAG: hypothetical protein Ct9H300mP1_19510 [Planctomycetaceae bacterium]
MRGAREDYDLALSLLNELGGDNREMRDRLVAAKDKRDARQRQVRQLRRLLVSAGVAILVLVSAGARLDQPERQISVRNEQIALENLRTSERNAYNSDMLLAQQHWEDADVHYLEDLLDRSQGPRRPHPVRMGLLETDDQQRPADNPGPRQSSAAGSIQPRRETDCQRQRRQRAEDLRRLHRETLVTFAGHDGPDGCWCAGFSPDGKRIVRAAWTAW